MTTPSKCKACINLSATGFCSNTIPHDRPKAACKWWVQDPFRLKPKEGRFTFRMPNDTALLRQADKEKA